jgi:voltage-gated potassium channel
VPCSGKSKTATIICMVWSGGALRAGAPHGQVVRNPHAQVKIGCVEVFPEIPIPLAHAVGSTHGLILAALRRSGREARDTDLARASTYASPSGHDSSEDPPPDRELLGVVERSFGRPLTARRAARIIASASVTLTITAGLAVWLFDHKEFENLNDALWWALQTVTTVGYGDIVPKQTAGRLIGVLLMLNGIALITVISAAVTATLIEQARRLRPGADEQLLAKLEQIESRLARMESGGSAAEDGPG